LVSLLWLKTYPTLDPDFGWHLSLGKEMVQSKHLIENFTGYNYFANLFTIDHQWLSDILLYLSYRYIGYWFLALIFFLISFITFLLLYKNIILSKIHSSIAGILVATSLLTASMVFCGIRLQYLLLLATVLLPYIFKVVKPFWLRLVYYFIIFALGSNLHGGFLTLAPIPFLLEISVMDFHRTSKVGSLKKMGMLCLILLLSFCTSPYGAEYWKFMMSYWSSPYYRTHIAEWLPIYAFPLHWLQVMIPLSLALFFLTIDKYWKKINKIELLMLLLYLYLGITSLRAFPVFIFLAAPYIGTAISNLFVSLNVNFNKIKYFSLAVFIAVAIFLIKGAVAIDFNKDGFELDKSYPEKALDYVSENTLDHGNLLNDYGWGGYQVWTHPELKVFIDGRNPNPFVDGKKTILEVYSIFFNGSNEEIESNFLKYDISMIILRKSEPLNIGKTENFFYSKLAGIDLNAYSEQTNLENYLDSSSVWQMMYTDSLAEVWSKKQ
jgi:hypothetical protein